MVKGRDFGIPDHPIISRGSVFPHQNLRRSQLSRFLSLSALDLWAYLFHLTFRTPR